MKLKRLAAFALTLAMALSLVVVSASAATFTDMTNHWARKDVEALADSGLINGYSDGTFKPDAKMTAAEALLFCARATGLDTSTKYKIAGKHQSELQAMLPSDMYSWAYPELAICLELGIITHNELQTLCQSGAISREISRENISFYLIRAMQLEPLAKSLVSYSLPFTDTASISAGLQPYVYLLNIYGIAQGSNNRFGPRDSVTRAVMSTLLSRAMSFMKAQGIVVEVPAYADNMWYGGVITSATTGSNGVTLLAYTSLSGAKTVSLPSTVPIYENNMLTSASALKAGQYARINLDYTGSPQSVRLGGEVTSLTGSITNLNKTTGAISLNVNGTLYSYTMDHFTEVKAGKSVGDMSIIDETAKYTTVTCQIDAMGHLASVDLTGGVHTEEGFLSSVSKIGTTTATVQVMGFDGVLRSYKIPATATVTVNGASANLSSTQKSGYVSITLNEEDNTVKSVDIDTKTSYIQGIIKGSTYNKVPNRLTLKNISTGNTTTYDMASNASVYYEGESINFKKVADGWFATVLLSGKEIATLYTYPGASTTDGVITNITYDDSDFIVKVKRADDTEVTFTMDLYDLPDMYRDNKKTTFDKLRTGDEVTVTVRYNEVDSIEATTQSANVKGTITRIISTTTGVTLDLTLDDGTTGTYQVASGVSVIQGDRDLQIGSLQPGYKVSMVVDGQEVISIAVDKSVTTNNMLTGSVIFVDTSEWSMLVQTTNASGNNIIVKVYADGTILDASGNTLFITSLAPGDLIQAYGTYDSQGFRSTIIIRT